LNAKATFSKKKWSENNWQCILCACKCKCKDTAPHYRVLTYAVRVYRIFCLERMTEIWDSDSDKTGHVVNVVQLNNNS